MMSSRDPMMVVLLLVFLIIAPSMADIISLSLRSDRRHGILFSKFGFSHTGHVSLQISSVSATSTLSQSDPSRIGFFLLSHDLQNAYQFDFQENPDMCVLDNEYISVLFTFQNVSNSSFNISYPVSSPDLYELYFANCNRGSFVTMDVRLELYNTGDNMTKDYLSAGLTHLPSLYLVLSILHLCFLGFWIYVCLKNKQEFHTIHFLMGVLLVATIAYFVCGAGDQHHLKVTGTRDHGWDHWFYAFQLTRFVILYTVIVLIETGFSLWKPFLQGKETLCLMIIILLQVLANVDSIYADATGPYNEKQLDWQVESLLLDLVCGFVVFAPLVWSGVALRKTCESDENRVEDLEKSGSFGVMLAVYVVCTRLAVPALGAYVEYTAPMVVRVAEETCNLAFCLVMFDIFRPCVKVKKQKPWYVRVFMTIEANC